ncbi:kinase-like domain-containing protein [Bipolaris maydis]|uniref:kinase-like domain-containing protein n=1 Tax=Cochliobolus heterostrophus TaxID=5016 RepID=UPI0024D7B925|nr:kinase-like domain-containing protein [Bipolaris maydis]
MTLSKISSHSRSIPSRRALAPIPSWRPPMPLRSFSSAPIRPSHCDIDAEPLHRYQWGGYHPVHLGDYLKNGRYKILHKLGWSGYSTVNRAFVAIKVCVSKTTQHSRELAVLGAMAAARPNQPGYQCLMTMQDYFQIHGPARLSGMLAKVIAKQTLTGLSFLHKHNIAHADLHTRNLAFTIPSIHDLHEEHLLQKLGQPETGRVQRTDRKPLEPNLPAYLVRPASYPINIKSSFDTIKIVHFGQSFFNNDSPGAFHTPLYYRAPEIIFNDNVDHRILVSQMLEMSGDTIPDRWQKQWHAMNSKQLRDYEHRSLQSGFEEVYFDEEKKQDVSREDIIRVGVLVSSMIRLEPSVRASVNTVLQDAWFQAS